MIRILCADLAAADEQLFPVLYEMASPERKTRADACRQPGDRLRCVTAEALLRKVLGRSDYRIEKNAFGKPCIRDLPGFYYNLSHSGRYVVIAWGDTEVGVDVQQHRDRSNVTALAERFFAPDELDLVRREPHRFYEIWTKKESYLKYTGRGLQKDLRSFSVLAPEPGIRYQNWALEGSYSLSLCSSDCDCTMELLDIRQLL